VDVHISRAFVCETPLKQRPEPIARRRVVEFVEHAAVVVIRPRSDELNGRDRGRDFIVALKSGASVGVKEDRTGCPIVAGRPDHVI
jgi:hypothetical protein